MWLTYHSNLKLISVALKEKSASFRDAAIAENLVTWPSWKYRVSRQSEIHSSRNLKILGRNYVKLLTITMNWVDTSKHHTAIHFFGLAMDSPVPRGVCGTATPTPRSSPGNESWRRRKLGNAAKICGFWMTNGWFWLGNPMMTGESNIYMEYVFDILRAPKNQANPFFFSQVQVFWSGEWLRDWSLFLVQQVLNSDECREKLKNKQFRSV